MITRQTNINAIKKGLVELDPLLGLAKYITFIMVLYIYLVDASDDNCPVDLM